MLSVVPALVPPNLELVEAREVVAHHDSHPVDAVLDACTTLILSGDSDDIAAARRVRAGIRKSWDARVDRARFAARVIVAGLALTLALGALWGAVVSQLVDLPSPLTAPEYLHDR